MNNNQPASFEAARWFEERKLKQIEFTKKLNDRNITEGYSFLSFDESDNIQLAGNEWPSNLKHELQVEVDISELDAITTILRSFTGINSNDFCYVFSMKYNFGLIKLANELLIRNWTDLLEIDGEIIFCHIPERSDFICIQKRKNSIEEVSRFGSDSLYEVTFSNNNLKSEILLNGA